MPGTDNSLLAYKAWLRVDHLPCGPVKVLDCYGGHGVVWDAVRLISRRRDIARTGIDTEKRKGCVKGDNRKWLMGMDLSRFDVVDLDAYGIPYAQAKILFEKRFVGAVFFTFIQSGMGMMPTGLLTESGITPAMRKLCPTLYGQMGWQIWLDWLANNGVERVFHRSKDRKHYGCFVLTDACRNETIESGDRVAPEKDGIPTVLRRTNIGQQLREVAL